MSRLATSFASRTARIAALGLASLALISGATVAVAQLAPPHRETRSFGRIAVTANRFEHMSHGALRASGDVHLGSQLRLTGAGASVEFDGASMLGAGTLELAPGNLPLFSGGFRASAATGVARPLPGAWSKIGVIGKVKPVSSSIREVNMATGAARGEALVRLGPNQQVTSTLGFDLIGGLFSGRLSPVEFEVSGVTIAAPNGLQLVDGGFFAPQAVLTLPPQFGSGSVVVNDLRLSNQTISLGGANGLFNLPEIDLGRDSGIRLTNNVARLDWDSAARDYRFDMVTSVAVDGAIPGAVNANVTLQSVDGQPQLNGTLDDLAFNVGGGRLTMPEATINNASIVAPSAVLAVPTMAGDVSFTVNDAQVGAGGLSIGNGQFFMPGFTLADGSMGVTDVQAQLVNTGGQYAIGAQGTLTMNLPGNEQSTDVTLTIAPDGQVSSEVVGLQLNVAGTTLTLDPTVINNNGLATDRAMLQLPPNLGGATTVVTDVVINQNGLSFGSAGTSVMLPDIPIGEGISLTNNSAVVSVLPLGGKKYYTLNATSTLDISWPGNEQQQQIQFAIAPDATGQAQVLGSFPGLDLNVGGAQLLLDNVLLNNAGLFAMNAAFALPRELGGTATVLSGVSITSNGLAVRDGVFALPPIVLADGALTLTGAQANLTYTDEGYRVTGQGQLALDLPDGAGATNAIAFTLYPDGSMTVESPGLAIDTGIATLALGPAMADGSGVVASQASVVLPNQLGSLTLRASDLAVSPSGVSIGDAAVGGQVPDITLGRTNLTDNAVNVVRLNTESGQNYALVVDGTLDTGNGARPVRVVLNTGALIDDPDINGLSLKLGDVNFTIMGR